MVSVMSAGAFANQLEAFEPEPTATVTLEEPQEQAAGPMTAMPAGMAPSGPVALGAAGYQPPSSVVIRCPCCRIASVAIGTDIAAFRVLEEKAQKRKVELQEMKLKCVASLSDVQQRDPESGSQLVYLLERALLATVRPVSQLRVDDPPEESWNKLYEAVSQACERIALRGPSSEDSAKEPVLAQRQVDALHGAISEVVALHSLTLVYQQESNNAASLVYSQAASQTAFDFEVVGTTPSSIAYTCRQCRQTFEVPASVNDKKEIIQTMRSRLHTYRDRHELSSEYYNLLYHCFAIPSIFIAAALTIMTSLGAAGGGPRGPAEKGGSEDVEGPVLRVLIVGLGAINTMFVSMLALFGFQGKSETHSQAAKLYDTLLTSLEYRVEYLLSFATSGGGGVGDRGYDAIDEEFTKFVSDCNRQLGDIQGNVPSVPIWVKEKVSSKSSKSKDRSSLLTKLLSFIRKSRRPDRPSGTHDQHNYYGYGPPPAGGPAAARSTAVVGRPLGYTGVLKRSSMTQPLLAQSGDGAESKEASGA